MGIIDDVVMNAKSVASTVGKKAGQIVDLSKLKLNEVEIESDISKKFQTLGKLVYSATKDNSLASSIDEQIEEIDELYEQLDAIKAQIAAMHNRKACPQCKKVNDIDAVYCNACGALLVEDEKEEPVCCCEETAEEAGEEAAEKIAEEVKEASEE